MQERVAADPAFGEALLRESTDTMLAGDVETGKPVLHYYIKATIGFERRGAETGTQPKSLIRMFGRCGNSQGRNLFGILGHLQKRAVLALRVEMREG
ncbi:MAG: hypothetical protein WBQ75_15235 [Acetobacteraceae bacterium]